MKDSALVHVHDGEVKHHIPALWGLAALTIVVLVIQGVLVPWTLLPAFVAGTIWLLAVTA